MNLVIADNARKEQQAAVHCPICTHTVEAKVVTVGRTRRVKPGERCPRCHSPLEAAVVIRFQQAA